MCLFMFALMNLINRVFWTSETYDGRGWVIFILNCSFSFTDQQYCWLLNRLGPLHLLIDDASSSFRWVWLIMLHFHCWFLAPVGPTSRAGKFQEYQGSEAPLPFWASMLFLICVTCNSWRRDFCCFYYSHHLQFGFLMHWPTNANLLFFFILSASHVFHSLMLISVLFNFIPKCSCYPLPFLSCVDKHVLSWLSNLYRNEVFVILCSLMWDWTCAIHCT